MSINQSNIKKRDLPGRSHGLSERLKKYKCGGIQSSEKQGIGRRQEDK